MLYEAFKQGLDLSNVPLSLRLISSTDDEIVNDIVRGTNRQNIVFEEAFEATKKFHKDLEEFFIAYSSEPHTIYYERRSKQYQHNPTIKQTEKVNLKILTQYFLGMYENKPHLSHRHESVLLKEHRSNLYQDFHSKLPYYVTSFALIKFEKYLRDNPVEKLVRTFKPHILMMFRQSIAGYVPSFTKENQIDEHSEKIMIILRDDNESKIRFDSMIQLFMLSINKWETELGKSKRGTKDVESFTKHLLDEVNIKYHNKSKKVENILDKEPMYLGEIVSVIKDKYGKYYGFIQKSPDEIFFHSNDNIEVNFSNLKGKKVLYEIIDDIKSKTKINKKALIKKII